MSIEQVLQSLRTQLAGRTAVIEARAAKIRAAIDEYVRAHEGRLASEFALRNSLPFDGAPAEVLPVALALSALIAELPELANGAPAKAAAQPPAAPPAPSDPRSMREALDLAERALEHDFEAATFSAMEADEFLLHADEFAARARALQERTGGDPVSLRVIRRLTALVRERELPRKVYGLSRVHAADWTRLAEEARAKRLARAGRTDGSPQRVR